MTIPLTSSDASQIFANTRTDHADFYLSIGNTETPLNVSAFTSSAINFSFQNQTTINPNNNAIYYLYYSNPDLATPAITYESNPDIQLDNANDVSQWTAQNSSGFPLTQETSIKTEGTASIKQGPTTQILGQPGDVQSFLNHNQGQLSQAIEYFPSVTATINGSNYIYVLGGSTNGTTSGVQSAVYKATIDSSGNIGTLSMTNQGQLPQAMYAHSAVTSTINGITYIYIVGGRSSSAFLSTVYKAVINSSGDIGTFSTVGQGQLPLAINQHTTVVATINNNNFIYVLGGSTSSTGQSAVYRAQIDSSGNIGTFSTTNQGQLPRPLVGHTTVTATINDTTYVYVLGGSSGATVYKAVIDSSGNIGTFSTTNQGQLPVSLSTHATSTATINGTTYIYISGGASLSSTVYRAIIDSSGDIGTFSIHAQMPQGFSAHCNIAIPIGDNYYWYILGGYSNNSIMQSTVFRSIIDSSGNLGPMSYDFLPNKNSFSSAISLSIGNTSYVYILGGYDGVNQQTTVTKAIINSSGDIGTFSSTNQGQLPQKLSTSAVAAATINGANYVYVIGGINGSTPQSTVYRATISPSGDIGTFSTTGQGQLPLGLNSATANIVTINGISYLYILGGYATGTVSQNTVYQAIIDNNGNIGAFYTTNQGQLPQALYSHTSSIVPINGTNYVYVLGGYNSSAATHVQSTVYKAIIDNSGNIGTFTPHQSRSIATNTLWTYYFVDHEF